MTTGAPGFLGGGGEMGALMRAHDWAATPLGAPGRWPQSLKTVLRLLLTSQHPMFVWWGPQRIQFYNDAYRRSIGSDRHPKALGQPGRDCWQEIWPIIGPQIDLVMSGGGATWHRDALVPITRDGAVDQVYWTYGYSPIDDPSAASGVGGVLVICSETTAEVVARQQLAAENERLAHLFEQAPSFMVVLQGPVHMVVEANPGYMQLIGDRPVIGRALADALPEAADQGYVAQLDQVYASGRALTARGARFVIQHAPGGAADERFVDFVLQPMRDAGGAVNGIFVQGVDVTDRIVRERLAEEERMRLDRTLANVEIIGLWDWHVRNDHVIGDLRFAALHGLDALEAAAGVRLVQALQDVVDDDRSRVHAEFSAALAGAGGLASEYRIRHDGGGLSHVLVRGHVERGSDGLPQRLLGLVVDVTQQRLADAALRESDTRLRLVVEGAKDHAIISTDPEGVVTSWSAGAEAIFGWAASGIIGRPVDLLFTPEDRAAGAPAQELENARRDGCANDERWHLRRDGTRVFMNGSVHPLPPDADGRPQGFLKVARDETARRAAAVRRDTRERIGARIRDVDDPHAIGWAVAEVLGRTLDASRAAFGSYDAAAQSLFVQRDWHLPGLASRAGTLPLARHAALLDRLKHDEHVVVTDVRSDARLAAPVAADLDAGGMRAFVVVPVLERGTLVALLYVTTAAVRDWSADELTLLREAAERSRTAVERARGQQALREANETLEAKVQQRTRQLMLAEEALRQAQKMEAVGQLTGGLAHDFNNLLASISASSQVVRGRLQQGRLDGIDRYLDMTADGVRRAAALTQRLLAFSRRQTLDPKPTDVNRLVAGMEDLIRRTVGPDVEVEVEVVGAAGLWSTRIDPSQLESSLLNLCINARDAMAPAGGRMTIATANNCFDDDRSAAERGLPPGQYISLSVTDTGSGMKPEVVERIFDPFFTTKPLGQGTGLGLSMVYGFVRQSGGQVRVASEVGRGTTICIYLPRHAGQADGDGDDGAAALPPIEHGGGEAVLVIEDEQTIRTLVGELLQELGYRVVTAEDGPAGLRLLQSEQRIDLLITDVGLPGGLNGRQVADAGRALRPTLKVLFITGYAENAAVGNGLLDHGMAVLTKPFEISGLASKVREMLERAD